MQIVGCVAVSSYQGEILKLAKITRSEMGAYLCIASNGVPPSVSKRIMVNVHCKFHVSLTHCLLQGVPFKTQHYSPPTRRKSLLRDRALVRCRGNIYHQVH
jgi:hypothetical protein